MYLEIKPLPPTREEIIKAAKLSKLSHRPVAIIHGEPYEDCYEIVMYKKTKRKDYAYLVETDIAAIPFHGEHMKRSFWAMLGVWGIVTGMRTTLLGNIERCYVETREMRFENERSSY